jgi:hypothetical protein
VRKVPILREGNLQISFDEGDVRQACSMMRCGKSAEECIGRMIDTAMECTLCYIVLMMLKTPCRVEGGGFRDVQLN